MCLQLNQASDFVTGNSSIGTSTSLLSDTPSDGNAKLLQHRVKPSRARLANVMEHVLQQKLVYLHCQLTRCVLSYVSVQSAVTSPSILVATVAVHVGFSTQAGCLHVSHLASGGDNQDCTSSETFLPSLLSAYQLLGLVVFTGTPPLLQKVFFFFYCLLRHRRSSRVTLCQLTVKSEPFFPVNVGDFLRNNM